MTPREITLLQRMQELENLTAEQARSERAYTGGAYKINRPYVPEVVRISKLPASEQKQAARERIAIIRSDPDGPYFNSAHPDHATVKEEMRLLYLGSAEEFENE